MVNFGKFTTKSGGNKIVYSVFAGFSVFSFGFLSAFLISPNIDIKTSTNAVTQTVGPHTLSMASEESAEINITPTSEQAIYSATNNLTISNTCSAGATITINTSGANNSLLRASDGADSAARSIPATTGTSLDDTSWGYSLDSGTTWGAVPDSTTASETIYNGTEAISNTTVPIMFGAKIDSTLPSGAYTNDIVYTMTPKNGCLSYSVTWDFNGGNAKADATYPSTLNWGQTIDLSNLTPTRDGYTFTGWFVGSSTYTSEETSVDLNTRNAATITIQAGWLANTPITFSYTGSAQTWTVPVTGRYKVELWGAEGNYNGGLTHNRVNLGMGAYVSGEITLKKDSILYVYVGGHSHDTNTYTNANFNSGSTVVESNHRTGAGGGATDIRITNGAWNNEDSLRSRIIVAGGGGGTYYASSATVNAGYWGDAGGLTGYYGTAYNTSGSVDTSHCLAGGGTQTAGGKGMSLPWAVGGDGSFGVGGSGAISGSHRIGAGGGGGWYGGAGSAHYSGYCVGSGGGGSSYISGHTGSVGVTSTTSSSPKSGCTTGTTSNACSLTPYVNPVTNASYTFTNTVMIDGQGYTWTTVKGSRTDMPNTTGTGMENGHANSGHARITYLGTSI